MSADDDPRDAGRMPDADAVRVCGDTARNHPERLLGNHPNARDIAEGRATAEEVLASADAEGDAIEARHRASLTGSLTVDQRVRDALERAEKLLDAIQRAEVQTIGGTNVVALGDDWFAQRRDYFTLVEQLLERDPFKPQS